MCQIYSYLLVLSVFMFMYHHTIYLRYLCTRPRNNPARSTCFSTSYKLHCCCCARVCGGWCENCVFAASQQQIGCLSVWDRGPFYQQFHSIVKCENNKLSIQYRTDTIWISKGWFVKHKEKFLTVALSLCVGQKGALSINFALFRIRLGAGTGLTLLGQFFADYLLKCKWDQNVWV